MLKTFLEKLPEKILDMQESSVKLKVILNLVKELSEVGGSEQNTGSSLYTVESFMKMLVDKCAEIIDLKIRKK